MDVYEKLQTTLKSVRQRTDFQPKVALILGSGLGDFANQVDPVLVLPYSEIEGFPSSTVEGHAGQFIFGHHKGVPMVVMQGRVHFYEGYPMQDVVLPVRLMGLLGAEILFLTNAAGGCNLGFEAGDLMLIRDHIASMVPSPLLGKNLDKLGPRFPDMTNVYHPELRKIIKQSAADTGVFLREGVYMQFTGPQYETPTEVTLARNFGADAVGMSTACEALTANHMGMKVCGISCITNMAAGMGHEELSHKDVQATADRVAANFQKLVSHAVVQMGELS